MVVPAGVQIDFDGNLYIEGQTVPKAAEAALMAAIPQPNGTVAPKPVVPTSTAAPQGNT